MIGVLRVNKKMSEAIGVATQLSLTFHVENRLHEKYLKTSNISGTMQTIFFIFFSPCVLENNALLNKNYWDELDVID